MMILPVRDLSTLLVLLHRQKKVFKRLSKTNKRAGELYKLIVDQMADVLLQAEGESECSIGFNEEKRVFLLNFLNSHLEQHRAKSKDPLYLRLLNIRDKMSSTKYVEV